jgi:hypothetical protein
MILSIGLGPRLGGSVDGKNFRIRFLRLFRFPDSPVRAADLTKSILGGRPTDSSFRWWRLPSARPLPSAATKALCLSVDHPKVAVARRCENFLYWDQESSVSLRWIAIWGAAAYRRRAREVTFWRPSGKSRRGRPRKRRFGPDVLCERFNQICRRPTIGLSP